jgi:hypothetical protein
MLLLNVENEIACNEGREEREREKEREAEMRTMLPKMMTNLVTVSEVPRRCQIRTFT